MSLYGHRVESYRVELLDYQDNLIGELSGVTGGKLTWNANAQLHGGGSIELSDSDQEIDFSSNRIRPYIRIEMPEQIKMIAQPDIVSWLEERRNLATRPIPGIYTSMARASAAAAATPSIMTSGGPVAANFDRLTWPSAFTPTNSLDIAASTPVVNRPVVAEGEVMTGSLYVRSSIAQSVRASIQWLTESGGSAGSDSAASVKLVANAWTRISITAAARAGAVNARFDLDTGEAPITWSAGSTIDMQGLLIERSPSLGNYFDGNSTDNESLRYTWTGAVDGSESIQERITFTPRAPILDPNNGPGYTEWPLGVYVMAAPSSEYSTLGVSWSIDLIDKMTVIHADCITQTLQVAQGSNIIEAVKAQILATGETRILSTESSAVLSNTMTWTPGTSRLRIINDLLAVAGYWALSTDRWGQFVLEPYRAPADRPVSWSFEEGAMSLHSPDWEHELPLWDATNHVTLVSQKNDAGEVWVATAIDDNPDSPTSTVSMRRVLNPIVEENVEATSLEALQQQAVRKLIENSNVVGIISVSHAFVPVWFRDSIAFKSQGIDTKATITKMSLSLEPGSLIAAQWRQS